MENNTKWSIDHATSAITFKVRHLIFSTVKGSFKTFDASIYTNAKNFKTLEADLWIDVSSVHTGDHERDEHLKSADFFDLDNHKQIAFTASGMGKASGDGSRELWGDLTMKDISRPVRLIVEFKGITNDPPGNEKASFTITGSINRRDWGITWNASKATGGLMESADVKILCDIQLINEGQEFLKREPEPEGAKNDFV